MDDDDESEQVERVGATGSPDKAQVRVGANPKGGGGVMVSRFKTSMHVLC